MLSLYDLPISSYCCKIRIILRHKGLEWKSIPPPGGYGSDAYCKLVPSGTIPALDHDGFIVGESDAISEYLNELEPHPTMLPLKIQDRATSRALSRFHDTRIEPLIRAYFSQISLGNRDIGFITDNTVLLEKRFNQLDQIATPDPLWTRCGLSLADCGFVPSFAILRCLQAVLGFKLALPKALYNYETALCEHPSVCEEYNAYVQALQIWAASKE